MHFYAIFWSRMLYVKVIYISFRMSLRISIFAHHCNILALTRSYATTFLHEGCLSVLYTVSQKGPNFETV